MKIIFMSYCTSITTQPRTTKWEPLVYSTTMDFLDKTTNAFIEKKKKNVDLNNVQLKENITKLNVLNLILYLIVRRLISELGAYDYYRIILWKTVNNLISEIGILSI